MVSADDPLSYGDTWNFTIFLLQMGYFELGPYKLAQANISINVDFFKNAIELSRRGWGVLLIR